MPRRRRKTSPYDDFGQTARGLAETARDRSVEFGQAARDTVIGLDIEWAHGRFANVLRETVGRFLLVPVMNAYTRRRVDGIENLRGLSGPIVFVANHASHMDTPAILRALPRRWRRRTVVAAAADYFYKRKVVAVAVSVLFNTVPIERRAGRATSLAMTHIDRLLDRGNSLLLFPEGTRNRGGAVGRLRLGAAKIAREHGALIVPIYIEGTRAAMPPGRRWLRRRYRGLDPRRHRGRRGHRADRSRLRAGPPCARAPRRAQDSSYSERFVDAEMDERRCSVFSACPYIGSASQTAAVVEWALGGRAIAWADS
jgi:1-acyl-sn-glycerol-3-phosphate acyltransferase